MEVSWAADCSGAGGAAAAEEGDPCVIWNWAGMEPVVEGRLAVAQWVDLNHKENKGCFSRSNVTEPVNGGWYFDHAMIKVQGVRFKVMLFQSPV